MSDEMRALTEITFSLDTGGSERVAAAIAKHMQARGVRTTVCSTHSGMGTVGSELRRAGVSCLPLDAGSGGRLGRIFRLIRHLRATRTEVLHVHHFNMLAQVELAARIARVRRIVLTEHSNHQLRTRPAVLRRARRNARRADVVTVVHGGLAEYLTDQVGVPANKIRVIPNGVDTTVFTPAGAGTPPHPDLPSADFLCGCVGRLHPDKDPLNLVRALAQVGPADRQGIHVVFLGDGPVRDELENAAEDLGVAKCVTLLGDRQDVPDLLPGLDCFVLPSRTEGLPVALLEAMSCGLPVIATEVGGVSGAVGKAGVLVPPEDPRVLAEAIVRMAQDSGLRRHFATSARERAVEVHDRAKMFDAYEEVLFPEGLEDPEPKETR